MAELDLLLSVLLGLPLGPTAIIQMTWPNMAMSSGTSGTQ